MIEELNLNEIIEDVKLFKAGDLNLTTDEVIDYAGRLMGETIVEMEKFRTSGVKAAGRRARTHTKLLEALFMSFRKTSV